MTDQPLGYDSMDGKSMTYSNLNSDQIKVLEILNQQNLWITGDSEANDVTGIPYKEIMKETKLNKEKVLLSLGWLEALGYVNHNVAIQRTYLDYLGHCNVEVAGQKVLRIFSLTNEGKKTLNPQI